VTSVDIFTAGSCFALVLAANTAGVKLLGAYSTLAVSDKGVSLRDSPLLVPGEFPDNTSLARYQC
jgi:hypothetical protein